MIDMTLVGSDTDSNISVQTSKVSNIPVHEQHQVLSRKLEYYQNRLLKIDSANRSIILRGIRDLWCFDLSGIDTDKKIIDHALSDRKHICIVPNSDRSQQAEKQRAKLRKLYRNIIQIQRETGRQENYLGFPFLVGHFDRQSYVRGPLILFPVSLDYKENARPGGWYIIFTEDKDPILNRALMEKIRVESGRTLSPLFYNDFENLLDKIEEQEGGSKSLELLFLDGLVNILSKNEFIINNNYKLNKVEALSKINVSGGMVSTDDRQTWIKHEPLQLVNHKIIGIFPQGEDAIYSDYEDLINKVKESSNESFGIIEKLLSDDKSIDVSLSEPVSNQDEKSESISLDDFPTTRLNSTIASDASQDTVVLASMSCECIVVRGPPGTGKSQVIVNIISNALAKDEKVLLVCEKRDALDVVYQRLDRIGLSRYIAPLYDGKDRFSLYKKLANILDYKAPSGNATKINQEFNNCSCEIDRIIERQKRIADALRDESLVGVPVTKLYTLARPDYITKLSLRHIVQEVKYHTLSYLSGKIARLEDGCKKFDLAHSPWFYRKDFSNFGLTEKNTLLKIVNNILDLREKQIVLADSIANQQSLIVSLETLSNSSPGGNLFRKFISGGKERNAREIVKRYLRLPDDIQQIKEAIRSAELGLQFWNDFNDFLSFLTEDGVKELKNELSKHLHDSIYSRLNKIQDTINDFDELQAHDRRKAELSTPEQEILRQCMDKLSFELDWKEELRQEFYAHWIDLVESKHPDLKGQPFETYLSNREQLSELLKEHRKIVVDKILYQINESVIRPDITLKANGLYKAQHNKWSLLLDELKKRRHVLPIKKLLEIYENMVLRIAPCWLATPSAVSSIFPLKQNIFDYIIFDEASQSHVAQSLAALYRGKKVVIIGDEKQLPPIAHFRSKDDDEEILSEEDDRELLSESLLALANRTFNHSYLTWHYRSVHQELIDFSNHAFYDGSLKIAPNVSKPLIPSIKWISCNNGSWIDRRNKAEAELVVNQLKAILCENKKTGRNRSVGIITFNSLQKEEIWEEIERRKQNDQEFKALYSATDDQSTYAIRDLPFVRNIERVQGEERDIIIFSLGYAKDLSDPKDTFSVHFGSINGVDGENYLNVAIARAKQEIIIVCSFDPYKIRVDKAMHGGPKRLKEYLCYARSISESNPQETQDILSSLHFIRPSWTAVSGTEEDDSLQKLVKIELEKLGYQVDLHIGHSNYKIDLAVVHPDFASKYILAIECDGKSFQSAESTKERDITRQEFLESKGWNVEQIWSRNWWKDSNKEIIRLREKIEELRKIRTTTAVFDIPSLLATGKIADTTANPQRLIIERIKERESCSIERKSSFRYDIKIGNPNPKVLEKIIAKTVAAFMNAEGGTLFIGVDDEGNPVGLQYDYGTLKKQNTDGFEIELRQSIEKYTKNKAANEYLKIKFHPIEEKEICEVVIEPSSRPIFIYDEGGKQQECYVRVGNSSKPYTLDEFYEYSRRRFK